MENKIIYYGFESLGELVNFLDWKNISYNHSDIENDFSRYGQDLAMRIENGACVGGNPLRTYHNKPKYTGYTFADVTGTMRAMERRIETTVCEGGGEFKEMVVKWAKRETKTENKFMNKIFEALQYGFMGEPEKTYRKLGLIDGNNVITNEGAKLFLTYVLKNGSVDGFDAYAKAMLKEVEKESK